MKVIDSGHEYELTSLDGELSQRLVFVKREGPNYPGNVGHHPGTTMQDVLRCLIERAKYVNNQIPCSETEEAIWHMGRAIVILERRAARRHGRRCPFTTDELIYGETCKQCGHVGCAQQCRKHEE